MHLFVQHLTMFIFSFFQATDLREAEDAESIAAHVSGVQKELRKARPDNAYISDSMSRTFSARRAWISKEIPSMEQVTDKYPALMLATMANFTLKGRCGWKIIFYFFGSL